MLTSELDQATADRHRHAVCQDPGLPHAGGGAGIGSEQARCSGSVRTVDVCVVTYRNDESRIRPALRASDELLVRDNTVDNIGFAAAANLLAARGTQDVILFVNPDGDPQPRCFDILESAFVDVGVVAAEPSQGEDWHDTEPPPERMAWLSGACMAVRRSCFEEVGGFDERLFMYCEDIDLSFRLARLGRLVHLWEAEFRHDRDQKSLRSEFLQARNGLVLHRRYGVGPGLGTRLRGAVSAVRDRRFGLAGARTLGLGASLLLR